MGTQTTSHSNGHSNGHSKHPAHRSAADRYRARGVPTQRDEERFTAAVIAGGAASEATFSIGAIALAIIGLAGVHPRLMTAIAGIAVGIAAFSAAGAAAARWNQEVDRFRTEMTKLELLVALGAEVSAGIAGIVLSCVGLSNYAPHVVLAIAAIVYGGGLVLGAAVTPQVAQFVRDGDPVFERRSRLVFDASGGVLAFAALGAIVLGILALIGVASGYVLPAVAMLALSSATMLAGATETGRFAHRLRELA